MLQKAGHEPGPKASASNPKAKLKKRTMTFQARSAEYDPGSNGFRKRFTNKFCYH
jgi:hypothetical protein